MLWGRERWVQASRSGAPESRAPQTGGQASRLVRASPAAHPPSAGPPGSGGPARRGQARAPRGAGLRSRRPARVSGGTRGPSAWVPRTAASAVRGAVPPDPRPRPLSRAHAPTDAARARGPSPCARPRPRLGAGGGAGISGPLPQRSPRPARGSEDPWARGWRGSLVLAVPERGTRPHWAGAAPRGAGALSGCCPARVRGVGSARGSPGRISQPRPRLGGQCPGG